MYGKLINVRLVPAPNPLHINRELVYNPSSYLYEAVGYSERLKRPCCKQNTRQPLSSLQTK